MQLVQHNRLVSCNLLFHFAIFLTELYAGGSVTYIPSHIDEKCKGNQLRNKCKNGVAKIGDQKSLQEVTKAIQDDHEYWTRLSWHKNQGYCWYPIKTHCFKAKPDIIDSDYHGLKGWYCFVVKKGRIKLEAKKCEDEILRYICEQDTPTVMGSKTVSTLLKTTTSTESIEATSIALKLTAKTTQPTSITGAGVATTTTGSSARLLAPTTTRSRIVNTVVTSSVLTTARENIKKASTVTCTSTVTSASSKNTPTKGKQTAEEQFLQYVSDMKVLNASMEDSLQYAANTTNKFLKDLKKRQPENIDINLLLATRELESFALNYGKLYYESKVITQELFAIKVQKVSANNKEGVTFSINETKYSAGEGRAIISLHPEIFKGLDAVVVSIIYNGIAKWVPLEENVELDGKALTDLELGSRIIASTVDPRPTGILQENVTIVFMNNKETGEDDIPHCVFWDFKMKSKWNGSWSSTGCSLVKKVKKEITCTCNHLTNFAVLMQVSNNEVSPYHKMALDVITYVGCALSLVGEVLSIIAYCALVNLKEEQIQIRFNLVVAIAIAQITFLFGIDASETEGMCVFVAALIHYFYLAGFAWMLFEGVYLYLMVVKVYNTVVRMRLFYAVAWGLSLLIVVLSIVIASSQDGGVQSYVHGDFCWVSFTNNLIWTFVTPVLVVCLINSVILGLVIHEILKMQTDQTSELEKVRQGVKACVVLFPLLGMTWVFGVLSVTDAGLAFQYIFTIFNSLQGLFIFILHVLRNGDVRAAYSRKKQQWKQSHSIGTSYAAKQNSLDMSLKVIKGKEDSRNEHNSATPRSSVGYGSTIALQQKRSMTPVDT